MPSPHFAEFIIGPAEGRTRWLHAGYGQKKIAGTSVPAIRTFDGVTGSMRRGYDRLNEL
jgi:hypothetical protein